MIALTKSPLPDNIKIKSEKDYRTGEVLKILAEDCHNKCYLCEDKPTTINIEHIIPHRNDLTFKYDWNNIFIACGHCNNIKLDKYDNIINPIICDPEDHIALSIDVNESLIDNIKVESLSEDEETMQTKQLLELIYNGGTTDIKEIECANLRNSHLAPNIRLFKQYIKNHIEEPDLGYADMIKNEINRSSIFAAFKRKIIRDDPELLKMFEGALV